MKLAEPRGVVAGWSVADASTPVSAYFASFRWDPPLIDPASLTASAFLAMLDDIANAAEIDQ